MPAVGHAREMLEPRRVYIDLGTAWGDTMDLFCRGLAHHQHRNATNWEVYGFEAAPLLMPYVDQLVQWKNRAPGVSHPVTCKPPVGSSKDLMRFATLVGCRRAWSSKVKFCMERVFRNAMRDVRPNLSLLSVSTVNERLSMAFARPGATDRTTPCREGSGGARFTFIPAAVGARNGTMRFSAHGVVAGSGVSNGISKSSQSHMASSAGSTLGKELVDVHVVDLSWWLATHFAVDDYVVIKMDVEGTEFNLIPELARQGTLHLIDVLALECHGWGGSCRDLLSAVNRTDAGVKVVLGTRYEDMITSTDWKRSVATFREGLQTPACAHLNITLAPAGNVVANRT
jgi:FkbM family methyltransferase